MLTLLKKLFGKPKKEGPGPLAPTAATPSPKHMQFESAIQMAKVEVAKLSLAAIATKFPEEVRALLNRVPDEGTTVVLPVQTIVKQLPSGVVRMSLATLHRQAPAGLFKPLPAGDKRMVEVPLAEIFKHVKPEKFKRRADQRSVRVEIDAELELPVFNNNRATPPPEVADESAPEESCDESPEEPVAEAAAPTAPTTMRVVAPPSDLALATPTPPPQRPAEKSAKPKPAAAKPPTEAPAQASPASSEPVLQIPLDQLSAGWPEEITSSLAGLAPETCVAIPHSFVAPGLARGKLVCTWQKLSAWLTPPIARKLPIDPETPLLLPLKIVAPAFLAGNKTTATPRKSVTVDETIPALFSGGKPPTAPPEPAPEPAPEAVATPPVEIPPPVETQAEAPAPAPGDPPAEAPLAASTAPDAAPDVTPPASEPPAAAPAEATTDSSPDPVPIFPAPPTLGDALGEPGKEQWTPAELVGRVAALPGVAGAVVALQEGLPVAHALPADVNAETVAAFLPQIFTRLNQYAGEMKLGDVDDLLFTTRGAHCLIYRLGTVYFAVLGKPGQSLPWNELRLVAAELSRQVQK